MQQEAEAIFHALAEAEVRFLVVGGLAVMAHGYLRHTADVDLVIDLESTNLLKAMKALKALNYRPKVPVPIEDFSNPTKRSLWEEEKGMMVFSLWNPESTSNFVIDIFTSHPFEFTAEYTQAKKMELEDGIQVPFVSLSCLLDMKRKAGREKDLLDIAVLERKESSENSS